MLKTWEAGQGQVRGWMVHTQGVCMHACVCVCVCVCEQVRTRAHTHLDIFGSPRRQWLSLKL